MQSLNRRSMLYHSNYNFRYFTNLVENAPEGTTLSFEGGLDVVEDLDKVRNIELGVCIKISWIGTLLWKLNLSIN